MSQDFFGKKKTVKVRKDHICDMCGGPIPIGDKAIYRTGVYDGSFFAVYEHEECYEDFCEHAAENDYEYEPYSSEWPARIKKCRLEFDNRYWQERARCRAGEQNDTKTT